MGPFETVQRSRVVEIRRRLYGPLRPQAPKPVEIMRRGWMFLPPEPDDVPEPQPAVETVAPSQQVVEVPAPAEQQSEPPVVPDGEEMAPAYPTHTRGRVRTPMSVTIGIIREVCERHQVTVHEVRGRGRRREACNARHEVVFRLYTEHGMSTPEIGRFLGGRDHATVLASLRRYTQMNPEAAATIRQQLDAVATTKARRKDMALAIYAAGPISLEKIAAIGGVAKSTARQWVDELRK